MDSSEELVYRGVRLDNADFSGSRLHAFNFEGTRITDGWFVDADISADIRGLRVNGVEIEPLVEAERDRLFPERVKLRATDPAGLAEAWELVEGIWAATITRARRLPENLLHERVEGDWSFVETLRHLVMATDTWLVRMVQGKPLPYHPWGLAPPEMDPNALGLDPEAAPSLDDVLEVRRERMDAVRETIGSVTPAELERVCEPPDPVGHPQRPNTVLHCLHVILNEEWEHAGYANRDLAILEERSRQP